MLHASFEDDHVEVVDAPQRILVTDEVLWDANPRWLAEGDGIITLAPEHESRVSYRRVGFDLTRNMWTLERIS